MTRRGRVPRTLVAAAGLALTLCCAACTSQPSTSPPTDAPTQATHVDVDTPQLRAQKKAAGIEPCRPGSDAPADDAHDEAHDDSLPAVTLPCLGGGPAVDLRGLRGPLVINLFAQWCGPCRQELPHYQRLHEEAKGRLEVLGIDYLDTQPSGALALAEDTGVTFPLLADPDGTLREDFRIRGLPGVLFVDAQGRVTNPGGLPTFMVIDDYQQLTDLVRQRLGITVAAAG